MFRASYLSEPPHGGVRITTGMDVGQRLALHLAVGGFADPPRIDAVVQWSLPVIHPEGPAAGLAFVELSPPAAAWLGEVLDRGPRRAREPHRVVLLAVQPFLRDVYSREVRNCSELHDEPMDLVALDNPAAWLDELARRPALGIADVDDLAIGSLALYERARTAAVARPIILVGGTARLAPAAAVPDDGLHCLRKPLRFGALMATVRMLVGRPCASS